MITLNATEARVLGVLVEKALTTPAQYPLTLNGLVTGCNQRSNREPVMHLDEDRAMDAIESLQRKGLAREVMLANSRVIKYRQLAKDGLEVDISQLVVLTELMLRGPQTAGELRQRCSRMHTIDSMETMEQILAGLMNREPAMVRRLHGTRAPRYAQLVAPAIHPLEQQATPDTRSAETRSHESGGGGGSGKAGAARHPADLSALASRVETLEKEVERLRSLIED